MDGILPMSFALTDTSTRGIGQSVQQGIAPFLLGMSLRLTEFNRDLQTFVVMLGPLGLAIVASIERVQAIGIPVIVMNLDLLELLGIVGVTLLLFDTLLLQDILGVARRISSYMVGAIQRLDRIDLDLIAIGFEVTAIGASVCSLLQAILDELRKGLTLTGQFQVTINITESGGGGGFVDFLNKIDLLKLLGLLAILLGFVTLLGLALRLFTATAIAALAAISYFVSKMIPLVELLGKLSGWHILGIVVGLSALAGFVYLLALALNKFSAEALKALPNLTKFIEALGSLAEKLGKMSVAAIGGMAVALGALAGFVYALGVALNKMSAEVLKALPHLSQFIETLGNLAEKLGKMSVVKIAGMVVALGALSGFVYALGVALNKMSAEVLKALPSLSQFIDTLGNLAEKLGNMSLGHIAGLVVALGALGGFVYALGVALNKMSAEVLKALPNLSQFIDTLGNLATALSNMSGADIAGVVVGLGALAGFVYVLTLSLNQLSAEALRALPGLSDFINTLSGLASSLAALNAANIAGMVVGLIALAGFVYLLALAVNEFSTKAVLALPALSGFITTLSNLALTLASLSAANLFGMAIGLALLVGFVYFLGAALNTFSATVLMAIPAIAALIATLTGLVTTTSQLDVGQLIVMGIAFLLLIGFVWGLGAAAEAVAPGLLVLSTALDSVSNFLNTVVSAAESAMSALSDLGSVAGGVLDTLGGAVFSPITSIIPSFQLGGEMPEDGLAMLHAGERVLTVEENQMLAGAGRGGLPMIEAGAGGANQSVNIGAVTVTINAERLEADSAQFLSDEIIRQIQEKIGRLASEQGFRMGDRPTAPA